MYVQLKRLYYHITFSSDCVHNQHYMSQLNELGDVNSRIKKPMQCLHQNKAAAVRLIYALSSNKYLSK